MLTIMLALLYPIAIQYQRGGAWMILIPIVAITLIVDIFANYTELSLAFWELPKKSEHTFSSRLQRLVGEDGWRGDAARGISAILNVIDPTHSHIRMA